MKKNKEECSSNERTRTRIVVRERTPDYHYLPLALYEAGQCFGSALVSMQIRIQIQGFDHQKLKKKFLLIILIIFF